MRVVTVPVLWLLLAVASPLRCSAQYLLFDNYVSGRIDGRVVDDEGTLLGTNYMAQLYAGPTTNSLLPVPDPMEFLMSLGHPTGTVPAGAVRIPGVKARR